MATNYIVLKRRPILGGDRAGWDIVGHVRASGPQVARKAVDPSDGEYLVVPIRNATFVKGETVQPEPKVTSTVIGAQTYLDTQPTLPVDENYAESAE